MSMSNDVRLRASTCDCASQSPTRPTMHRTGALFKNPLATGGDDAWHARGRGGSYRSTMTGSFPVPARLPAFSGYDNQKTNMVRAYGFLTASLGVTAASAYVAAATLPPLGLLGGLAVGGTQLALLMGAVSSADPAKRRALTLAYNAALGVGLSGMVSVLGAPMLITAGAYTAGVVGTMMAASLTFPAGSFSSWDGPLLSGLMGLVVCSAVTACLPASWGIVGSLDVAQSALALGLFSAFIMRDTSRMAQAAQVPREQFDPAHASLNIYLDVMNIFFEIVRIIDRAGRSRRD